MNNSKGRQYFLTDQKFINKIIEMVAFDCVKTKVDVFEILGALCLVPGGWKMVLDAVDWLEQWGEERARFLVRIEDFFGGARGRSYVMGGF